MPDADAAQQDVRRRIEVERDELARSIDRLRAEADLTAKLRARLPLLLAGSLGAGFLLGGGVGATARLLMRRGREGEEKARLGRFSLAARS